MVYTAAVITISDKGSVGLREDTSGPALCEMLKNDGWDVVYTTIIPDEQEQIKSELIACADERKVMLVGGTLGDIMTIEGDLAAGGRALSADGVDQGRLTGAVGADQSQLFAFLYVEGDAGQNFQTAEGFGQVFNLQQAHFFISSPTFSAAAFLDTTAPSPLGNSLKPTQL